TTMRKIKHEEPPPPTALRPDLDPRLEAICLRMLAKPLEERYQSMDEVDVALTGALTIPRPGPRTADQAGDRIRTVDLSYDQSSGQPPPFSSPATASAERGPFAAEAAGGAAGGTSGDDGGPGILVTSDLSMPPVHFVTAHGVGVRVKAGDRWKNSVLIHRNTQVPAEATRRYYTATRTGANTFIRIEITQGDTEDIRLAEVLGTGLIQGFPHDEPPGQPVDVTMQFDGKGRLHVGACYANTGQEMQMTIQVPAQLSEDEVRQQREFLQQASFLNVPAEFGELD
ncbi:MAG TPA: Hsp70 family protein, partial [Planctomycetaceae bacterium]|nr:Hsp70 family protein [Planctomycetaceae bacterium]